MTYAHEAIQNALYDWVQAVTGRVVAWEHQNAPKRAGILCTLLISPSSPVGRDAVVYRNQIDPAEGEDVWETIQSHRTLSLSLNLWRGAVHDDMALLKASVYQDVHRQSLHAAKLGFITASDSRDLSGIVHDTEREARLQADFEFSTAYETEAELITIQSIDITNAGTGDVISVVPAV